MFTSRTLASVELLSVRNNKIKNPDMDLPPYSSKFDQNMKPIFMRLKLLDMRGNPGNMALKPHVASFLEETVVLFGQVSEKDVTFPHLDEDFTYKPVRFNNYGKNNGRSAILGAIKPEPLELVTLTENQDEALKDLM